MIRLPQILSPEEVARLIDAADSPFHRAMLLTLYATGARRAEAAHLKVGDIDSGRMVVHIHGGKGNRDRDVMLSPKLLDALRDYWRGLRRRRTEWLLPGNAWHTSSRPVTTKVFWAACQSAAERAGLDKKRIYPHLLRRATKNTPSIAPPSATQPNSCWQCPICGGTMHMVERISAAELRLRAPPQTVRCAA